MSISKKLYVNFGAVLLAVVVLFTVIVFAVHREQSAKAASSWVKTSTDALNLADGETKHLVEQRRKDDEAAGTEIILIASLSTLVALALGGIIAFRTAKSITNPLTGLIKVARQIGESGDLD